MKVNRRNFMGTGALAGLGLALPKAILSQECDVTTLDRYGLGPFHREDIPDKISLGSVYEPGSRISISGVVRQKDCSLALPGTRIEVWLADSTGCYSHPNSCAVDQDYHLYGALTTDVYGTYSFESTYPGAYPLNDTIFRTPHIHFYITTPRGHSFITQMYFAGADYLDEDLGSSDPNAENRIVTLNTVEGQDLRAGTFDIVLDTLESTTDIREIETVRKNNLLSVRRVGSALAFVVPFVKAGLRGKVSIYNSRGILVEVIPLRDKTTIWHFKSTSGKIKSGQYTAVLEMGYLKATKQFLLR